MMSDERLTGEEQGGETAPEAGVTPPEGISRRSFLGATTAALATAALAAGAARGQTVEEATQGENDRSASNPGPENAPLASESPNSVMPPPTDHGDVPAFWYSFALAHRRVQEGG